jgi:hypothetical protein
MRKRCVISAVETFTSRASPVSLSLLPHTPNSEPLTIYALHMSQMSGNDIKITEDERWFKDGIDVDTVDISEVHW